MEITPKFAALRYMEYLQKHDLTEESARKIMTLLRPVLEPFPDIKGRSILRFEDGSIVVMGHGMHGAVAPEHAHLFYPGAPTETPLPNLQVVIDNTKDPS